jgi:hypothetical protein
VAFAAFYERGFSVPSHRFCCSLPQHYGLELHNLTLSGILHIVAFVTLCEAYMGIDPHFDLWNYFFCVRRLHDPDVELIISRGGGGGVVIHTKSGHDIDPYFDIPKPGSMKEWWKKWFYLRKKADVPLPTFTSNRPIPLPT